MLLIFGGDKHYNECRNRANFKSDQMCDLASGARQSSKLVYLMCLTSIENAVDSDYFSFGCHGTHFLSPENLGLIGLRVEEFTSTDFLRI